MRGRSRGRLCVFDSQSEGFCHAFAVCRIATVAVADMAVFDEVGRVAHCGGGVAEQCLFLRVVHQVEQGARLAEIVVIVLAVVPVRRVAVDFQRRFGEVGLLLPLAEAIGFVVRQAAVVAVGASLSVALVAVNRATRTVDRDLAEVHAQAVALRVGVIEQTGLQHFIQARADTWNEVARCEGGLFHIGEEVFGIAVQLEFAHFNQRIVFFGQTLVKSNG